MINKLKEIFKLTIENKRKLLAIEFLSILMLLIETIRPYFVGESIDLITGDSKTLILRIIIISIFVFVTVILDYIQRIKMSEAIFNNELSISKKTYKRLLIENDESFSFESINEIFTSDISNITKLSFQIIDIVIYNIISIIFILFYSFKISKLLCFIMLLFVPSLYLSNKENSKNVKKITESFKVKIDNLFEILSETTFAITIIKAMKLQHYLENKAFYKFKQIKNEKIRLIQKIAKKGIIYEIQNHIYYLTVLGISVYLIKNDIMSIGGFIAFNTYSAMFLKSIFSISEILYMFNDLVISFDRIEKLFENNDASIGNFIIKDNISIMIENLSVVKDETVILKNINLNLPEKGMIFIFGDSGSGKSTLLKIIAQTINKYKGSVLLNERFLNIGYVPQTPMIFKETLLNNIKMDRESNFEFDNLVKELGISSLLTKYENKPVLPNSSLSGGEKQKISFARAIYNSPQLLILDEFDTGVDFDSKTLLYEALRKRSNELLMLIATHNFEFIKEDDLCIFIENGEIIYYGEYKYFKSKTS